MSSLMTPITVLPVESITLLESVSVDASVTRSGLFVSTWNPFASVLVIHSGVASLPEGGSG